MKGFILRADLIQLEEHLMESMRNFIDFPRVESRSSKSCIPPKELTPSEIKNIISEAKSHAEIEAMKLGMINTEINSKINFINSNQ
jgi:hypothetical protein